MIRKAAGIEFPGWDATVSWLIAEVEIAEEPPWGFRHDAKLVDRRWQLERMEQQCHARQQVLSASAPY